MAVAPSYRSAERYFGDGGLGPPYFLSLNIRRYHAAASVFKYLIIEMEVPSSV